MNFPVEILHEYAKDPEVKTIAEAFLLEGKTFIVIKPLKSYYEQTGHKGGDIFLQ